MTAAELRDAPTRAKVDALMKRCQIGVGGRHALDDAHDIMAECYGTLGRQQIEIETLRAELASMTADRDSWADQASQRTQDALDLMAAEREMCARIAESWATEETAMTCANVAAAIRGARYGVRR